LIKYKIVQKRTKPEKEAYERSAKRNRADVGGDWKKKTRWIIMCLINKQVIVEQLRVAVMYPEYLLSVECWR